MRSEIPITVLAEEGGVAVPVLGASIDVRLRGGAATTVYRYEVGGEPLVNPLTSDAQGHVEGWLDRGAYQATVAAPGLAPYIVYFDIAPAGAGAIDAGWMGANSVGTSQLQNQAVTGPKIAPGAVAAAIGAGEITNTMLAGQAVSIEKLAAEVLRRLFHPGMLVDWTGRLEDVPSGFVGAYGQSVSKATPPAEYVKVRDLWLLAGYPYGSANGGLNFLVPDSRGRDTVAPDAMGGVAAGRITTAVVGVNPVLGAVYGVQQYALQPGHEPRHRHGYDRRDTFQNAPPATQGGAFVPHVGGLTDQFTDWAGGDGTQSDGPGLPHINVDPSLVVNKIVCLGWDD